MALVKMGAFYPNHGKDAFDGHDITHFTVYADDNGQADSDRDKVGTVTDMLVDENDGRFRYFIVDTGFWVFGKKVLLPVGLARLSYDNERIFVQGLTKEQVENLPEFSDDLRIDRDYEDRVRTGYRPLIPTTTTAQSAIGAPYDYGMEPYFYDMNDPQFRSYEQRLWDRRGTETTR